MPEPNAARGATEAAPRVEYELQLYYWMKLIRVKMGVPCRNLQLLHRGLRHRRFEGRQGTARLAKQVTELAPVRWTRAAREHHTPLCGACVWRITDFPKNQQFATHRLLLLATIDLRAYGGACESRPAQ